MKRKSATYSITKNKSAKTIRCIISRLKKKPLVFIFRKIPKKKRKKKKNWESALIPETAAALKEEREPKLKEAERLPLDGCSHLCLYAYTPLLGWPTNAQEALLLLPTTQAKKSTSRPTFGWLGPDVSLFSFPPLRNCAFLFCFSEDADES